MDGDALKWLREVFKEKKGICRLVILSSILDKLSLKYP